jgi:hypothetical protein
VNPRAITWTELFDLVAALGYPLRRLSVAEWQAALAEHARAGGDNALAGLMPLLAGALGASRLPVFDCARTLADLGPAVGDCPAIDTTLLRTYFHAFHAHGFLGRPPPRPSEATPDSTGGERRGETACR